MSAAETHPDVLTWRVHPARERLRATLLTVVVVAAACWLTVEAMDSLWWGALAAAFFFVTLHRFFLPSEFRIDADGVSARSAFTSARFRWTDIRRFQHDRRGAFLSTRRRSSFLDAFQGMHLVFRGNANEVVRRIEARIRKPEPTPEVAP